ncbi:MAG: hypothetical protein AB1791_13725 [Chloroflexota bacterium]
MVQRSHPLFSRFGCSSTSLLVVVLGAILYFKGGGPFNPGPLTDGRPRGEPLNGFASHAEFEQDCDQCHRPWRGIAAARCENCHSDVAQERASGDGLHGLLPDAGRCASCHTDHKGREATITTLLASQFDHDRSTRFSLARHQYDYDGEPLACLGCHPQNNFAAERVDCVTCHTDANPPFMAEHDGLFGSDCLACHDGHDRLAHFDHNLVFLLDGAHATADCQSCHVNKVYAGTPGECSACHEEPAIHAGLFGLDCIRCHTTTAWLPAELTHHTFPLNHGSQSNLSCETCHEQSYTTYTCYNCHEHDPARVRAEHIEEGILDFEDCIECHPTGLKEEGENGEGGEDD